MWEGVIAAKVAMMQSMSYVNLVIVLYRMVTVSLKHRIETDQVTNTIDSGLGPLSRAEHRRPVVMRGT
jgi:hypothetical protein